MNIVVDAELMEHAVFGAVRAQPDLERRYHRRFAAAHGQPLEKRDEAFRTLHAEWFHELGLHERLLSLARECPHLHRQIARLLLHEAASRGTQGCELFGKPDSYSVVAAVHVATLLDAAALQYWGRHEFRHVEDMLDPAFAYDPSDRPDGPTAAARHLVRDRFAVLWALSIDARLARRMTLPAGVLSRRQREFSAAFGICGPQADGTFASLWAEFERRLPTHAELLTRARAATSLARIDPDRGAALTPPAGAPCPLCGFSTFDWAPPAALHTALCERVILDFPNWSASHGVCGCCAELYRSRSAASVNHA